MHSVIHLATGMLEVHGVPVPARRSPKYPAVLNTKRVLQFGVVGNNIFNHKNLGFRYCVYLVFVDWFLFATDAQNNQLFMEKTNYYLWGGAGVGD